jgi:hypothetical protein
MINVADGFGWAFAQTPLIKTKEQIASLDLITKPRDDRAPARFSLAV